MSLPRMSFHIGDYLKDTKHLNAAEHGAYVLLIMHYWANGSLPSDERQLAQIACMKASEWRKARPTLHALFKNDQNWKHKRIEKEIADAEKKYQQKVEAGKKSAEKRKTSENPRPTDVPTEAPRTAQQPITDNPNPNQVDDDDARAQATRLADEIATICGYPDPKEWPIGFCGSPLTAEKWIRQGWPRDVIIVSVNEQMRKRDGPPNGINYFEKGIADAVARYNAPLPEGKSNGKTSQRGELIPAADALIARIAEFNKPAPSSDRPGESAVCSGEGARVVRLLSKG